MDVPAPSSALVTLAAFVRARLADASGVIGGSLTSLLPALDTVDVTARSALPAHAARQFATAIVGAAAPFAPTSYSRARLIRQMHASGLLTDDQARLTTDVLDRYGGAGAGLGGAGTGR